MLEYDENVTGLRSDIAMLDRRLVALDQRLSDVLPQLITKADLQKLRDEIRLWLFVSWITQFFSLAGLQVVLFVLARH